MNKMAVTTLESKFRVFDMRTQHPTNGFACLSEKVGKCSALLIFRKRMQTFDSFKHSEHLVFFRLFLFPLWQAHKATVWCARHLPQNRDLFMTGGGNGGYVSYWITQHPAPGPVFLIIWYINCIFNLQRLPNEKIRKKGGGCFWFVIPPLQQLLLMPGSLDFAVRYVWMAAPILLLYLLAFRFRKISLIG